MNLFGYAGVAGRAVMRGTLALALPQRCPGCAGAVATGRLLCGACEAAIPIVSIAVCARCLARGGEGTACARHADAEVWPAWVYDERASRVVHALKYEGRTRLAPHLARVMARALPARPAIGLVVPMPLHPARRRERGGNQAEALALALSARVGAPCVPGALVRVRATPPQARLDPDARRANVKDAFQAPHPEWVRGRTVLLVDDVITTGATFEAALGALRRHGARAVGAALAWAQ